MRSEILAFEMSPNSVRVSLLPRLKPPLSPMTGANVVDEEIERTEDEVILERDMLDGIVEMQPRIAAATLGLSGIPF